VTDDYVTAARVGDVAPGTGKAVVVGEREIALFNVGGRYYADRSRRAGSTARSSRVRGMPGRSSSATAR